ncbi:protein STAY-GREEN homolog, chloroplastic-like [Telopea speciosissima]|uniref:protein STAY-GREEN homolog, chloroplastic-like n=1 Tax=Telopea speciosissima TaxID=54955 RepID=UPI001CC74D18|nr:protein STAY-GREEN homolog, chloroplastic-like [Telopea speciosissima]
MQVARLFGPAILGVDKKKHPGNLPRTYMLTHSDITSKLTLATSQSINSAQLQGWYNRLQRDEVVAEWKKVKGKMSLHVHCHISGGHFLLNLIATQILHLLCFVRSSKSSCSCSRGDISKCISFSTFSLSVEFYFQNRCNYFYMNFNFQLLIIALKHC